MHFLKVVLAEYGGAYFESLSVITVEVVLVVISSAQFSLNWLAGGQVIFTGLLRTMILYFNVVLFLLSHDLLVAGLGFADFGADVAD